MPKWIHDRAYHIMSKNPDMKKETAFAVATQQAHKLGKTPKDYGTSEGKKKAKKKLDKPTKEYKKTPDPGGKGKKHEKKLEKDAESPLLDERGERSALPWLIGGAAAGAAATARKTADPQTIGAGALAGALTTYFGSRMLPDPKVKEAEALSNMSQYDLARMGGFSDELQKIAQSPGAGKALMSALRSGGARFGELMAGGKPTGTISRAAEKLKGVGVRGERPVKSLTGVSEFRAAKDPAARKEIAKVIGARGGTAAAAGGGAAAGIQKHRKTERKQLGKAYVTGARDMYGQLLRRAAKRRYARRAQSK